MAVRKARGRANLSAHREEIRRWVEEGRPDSEIASRLSTSQASIQSFRSRHGIHRRGGAQSGRGQIQEQAPTEVFEGVLEHPPPTRRGNKRAKGIWIDPAIADTQSWSRSWRSVRKVRVRIGESSIIIESKREGEQS